MGYLARTYEHYKGLPHQREAIAKLEGMISPEVIDAFRKVFSPERQRKLILQVPFFSQLDNLRMPQRTCNPSSCAMCLEYLRPYAISADDELIDDILEKGFDVSNHQALTIILRSYGVESVFRYDLTRAKLEEELKSGRPVVMGILHKGPATEAWGGHMVVAVGLDPQRDALICHDPYGSLLSGYRGTAREGRFVTYPWSEIGPRWLVEGPESGWGRIFLTNKQEPLDGHLRAA